MAALRWILLFVGVAFLGGLLWWESRRAARERSPASLPPARSPERSPPLTDLPSVDLRREEPLMGDVIEFSDAFEPLAVPPAAPSAATPAAVAIESAFVSQPQWGSSESEPADSPVPPVPLIVDWPPEQERHILSLRIVPASAERFGGRPLRQALAACGFVHGRFGIYHHPGEDGRAILSAASLSRPGVLDPDNMDFQRFVGLNLFAVLPGVLSPQQTLERLLAVATDLAERSDGVVQDEHGVRLDDAGVVTLRHGLDAAPPGLSAEPAA